MTPFCQKQWAAALVCLYITLAAAHVFDCALILKIKID